MTYRLAFAAWFSLVLLTTAATTAEELKFEITVDAGQHERQSTPIRAALPVLDASGLPANATGVLLESGDDVIPAQLTRPGLQAPAMSNPTRTLHFILPSLKAGATATFKATVSLGLGITPAVDKLTLATRHETSFAWTDTPGEYAELTFGKPVLRYMYRKLDDSTKETREQTYKPFHHVYSPDGSRIVTKGPGGKYTHHRGLYFGFNRISYGDDFVKKCDVWHCGGKAYQAHEAVLNQEQGFVLGRHKLQIGWHGAEGEKFADETREVSVYNAGPGQFIEFASIVSTVDGPIKLDGDPQHSGFHFRADNEVADTTAKQTYFLRPDGKGGPGETRNWDAKAHEPKAVDEPWKAMSFVLGDKRYSVLRIDHPENPGEHRSSERDYGRVGGYFEYDVTKDSPLRVKYRVVLKDGEFDAAEAERLTADFVDPPKITIKKL